MKRNYHFLIVENEMLIAETILSIFKNAGYDQVRITNSVNGAIEEIEKRKPDLVLVDISLEGDRTGLELGQILSSEYRIPFIYVTSHSGPDILEKAKQTRPGGYILKPFKNDDLLIALEFAFYNFQDDHKEIRPDEELIVKSGRAIIKLLCKDILWLEAEGNYTTIILRECKRCVIRYSISEVEAQLNNQNFIRIHKSFIANLSYITKIRSGAAFVQETELPVGRTYQKVINSYFKK